jgi:hypothetical protein
MDDAVAAHAVLANIIGKSESELLLHHRGEKAANRMGLPAGSLHQDVDRHALRGLELLYDDRGLRLGSLSGRLRLGLDGLADCRILAGLPAASAALLAPALPLRPALALLSVVASALPPAVALVSLVSLLEVSVVSAIVLSVGCRRRNIERLY